jgi:hypothetical protein
LHGFAHTFPISHALYLLLLEQLQNALAMILVTRIEFLAHGACFHVRLVVLRFFDLRFVLRRRPPKYFFITSMVKSPGIPVDRAILDIASRSVRLGNAKLYKT